MIHYTPYFQSTVAEHLSQDDLV